MKIGILVDGQAEYHSLPLLWPRVDTPHELLRPLYADLQPLSAVGQIARAVKSRLSIFEGWQVDKVVILIDRESGECPGQWAGEIEGLVAEGYRGRRIRAFSVVSKVACFENWLIGDVSAIALMTKRFRLEPAAATAIVPNAADGANAQAVLKGSALGKKYSKIEDAMGILTHADPQRIAANSRSFRRFLRVVENPTYSAQSLEPAA